MSRSMKKFVTAALATVTVLCASLAGASPASASAFGCQYVGGFGFSYQGLTLQAPKGYLCHDIRGSGRTITSESASYGPAPSLYGVLTGRVCNWRIDFYYRNTTPSVYRTDYGPTQNTCNYTVSRSVSADKALAYYGTACARLVVSGVTRVTQCHQITA